MKQLGKLDRRVELKHLVRSALDSNGHSTESWTTFATVWARKIEVGGREFFQAATKDAETTVRFEIRYRDDVVATDRLVCEGRDYQLIQPPSEMGRRDGLTLFVRAVVNA